MFQAPTSENKLIRVSEDFVDFGFSDYQGAPIVREITITNKMPCKITVFWTIQNHQGLDESFKPVFNVAPQTASIKPYGNLTFSVSFKPLKSNFYFFQVLQFFAFKYSAKLTKKIIEDAQKQSLANRSNIDNLKLSSAGGGAPGTSTVQKSNLTDFQTEETLPPFCVDLRCIGHSFGDGSQPFIPNVKPLPSDNVFFSACSKEESLYQTLELHNYNDTPTYFKFSPDPNKIFRVFPNVGLIEGKSFQIVLVEFLPTEFRAYDQVLNCYLNHNFSNPLKIAVHGFCSEPSLQLQNSG